MPAAEYNGEHVAIQLKHLSTIASLDLDSFHPKTHPFPQFLLYFVLIQYVLINFFTHRAIRVSE